MKHSTLYLMSDRLRADDAFIPARRAEQETARRRPAGGKGANPSRSGYTWRDAALNGLVCPTSVTPLPTVGDSAPAAARRVCSAPTAAPTGARANAGHTRGEWSAWLPAGGVECRYRWGLNPRALRHAGSVDAMFQVRNLQTRPGERGSLAG